MPHDEVKTEDRKSRSNQREEVGNGPQSRAGSLLLLVTPARAELLSQEALGTPHPRHLQPPEHIRSSLGPLKFPEPSLPVIHSLPARGFPWLLVLHRRKAVLRLLQPEAPRLRPALHPSQPWPCPLSPEGGQRTEYHSTEPGVAMHTLGVRSPELWVGCCEQHGDQTPAGRACTR